MNEESDNGGGQGRDPRERLSDELATRSVTDPIGVVEGLTDEQVRVAPSVLRAFDGKRGAGSGLLVWLLRQPPAEAPPPRARAPESREPLCDGEVWMSHAELAERHNRTRRRFVGNIRVGTRSEPTFVEKAIWPSCEGNLILDDTLPAGVWIAVCDRCGEEVGIPPKDRATTRRLDEH